LNPILLPVTPNSPCYKNQKTSEGVFQLKTFGNFNFIQNVLFDSQLIKYDDKYQNNQSHSKVFQRHMAEVYALLRYQFPKGTKLVEVGCGKGSFLEIVRDDKWFDYEGYDEAYEGGDENIYGRYLNYDDRIEADIVVLRHTLEHIKSPFDFLTMLRKIFGDKAFVFIEVPQFSWIDKHKVLFDFTYEHVNYFSTESLCSLFGEVMSLGDFFGGQYQYCLASLGKLNDDDWHGFNLKENWRDFNFDEYLSAFKNFIKILDSKKRVWVWGGATKGVLFLKHLFENSPSNFKKIESVIDANPKKQSFFTPSTNLPIIFPNNLYPILKDGDYIIVMNPNYLNEIKIELANKTDASINIEALMLF
jgi:hypothetical protein